MKKRAPKFGDKMKVLVENANGSGLKKNQIVVFWYKIDKYPYEYSYAVISKKDQRQWYIVPKNLQLITDDVKK